MISETSEKQFKRDYCSNSPINVIPSKRISRPIIKSFARLNAKTLHCYVVKRIKAHKLDFTIFSGQDNAKILKTLKSALRSSKNVQQLDFKYDDSWNDEFMREFMEALETGRQIRQYQSETLILRSYSQSLRGQSSLKRTSFAFDSCSTDEDITKVGMSYLKRGFKSLTSLKHMKVDCSRITEKNSQKRGLGLRILRSLQIIGLDFGSNKTVTAKGIEKLIQGLKRLPHLQEIGLKFGECEGVTGPEFKHFGQSLNTFTRLQTVELVFYGDEWNDEKIFYIAQGITGLTFLSHFKLKISCSPNVTDKGMSHIGQGLKELIHLKSLEITFSKLLNITDEGLSSIGLGLETLVSLQKMNLSFYRCEKLTGTGMQSFSQAFKALCSLRTLDLRFHECHDFSDTGIQGISEGLKALISLKNLTLALTGCDITERGMQYLDQSWIHLRLERIELKFFGNALSDAMIEDLGKSLNQIASLKNVSLDLGLGQNLTMAGRNGFFQALSGHQCLKKTKFLSSYLKINKIPQS